MLPSLRSLLLTFVLGFAAMFAGVKLIGSSPIGHLAFSIDPANAAPRLVSRSPAVLERLSLGASPTLFESRFAAGAPNGPTPVGLTLHAIDRATRGDRIADEVIAEPALARSAIESGPPIEPEPASFAMAAIAPLLAVGAPALPEPPAMKEPTIEPALDLAATAPEPLPIVMAAIAVPQPIPPAAIVPVPAAVAQAPAAEMTPAPDPQPAIGDVAALDPVAVPQPRVRPDVDAASRAAEAVSRRASVAAAAARKRAAATRLAAARAASVRAASVRAARARAARRTTTPAASSQSGTSPFGSLFGSTP